MDSETLMTSEAETTTDASPESTAEQSVEQQAADGGQEQESTGQSAEPEESSTPEGAPETYEFQAPEGQEFDESMIGAFSEVAKESNLTQDAAQKILDTMGKAMQERSQATRESWADDTRADKEFGGAGLDANLATAKKALDAFGTPELRDLLNTTGLGNHPEIIRAFYRAGKQISEATHVGGKGTTGPKVPQTLDDYADALYPSSH